MVASVDQIEIIEIGQMGLHGTGVSAAQWAALQAIVASATTGEIAVLVTSATAFGVSKADATRVLLVNTNSNLASMQNGSSLAFFSDAGTTEQYRVRGNNGHTKSSGTSPGIAAGAAAGSGPTVAIVGTDKCGRITITPGTSPTTGILATITFAAAYASADYTFELTPADADAAATGSSRVFADAAARTTTTVTINVTGSALTNGTQYVWFYSVEEYEP